MAGGKGLPLFPVDEVVRNCPADSLLDSMHLSGTVNAMVAEALLRHLHENKACDPFWAKATAGGVAAGR